MKKIIIVNNNMKVGGVQKSLYNLLWAIKDRYDVTLYLFHDGGSFQLPPNVKVLHCDGPFRYFGLSQGQCKGGEKYKRAFLRLICRYLRRPAAVKLMRLGKKKVEGYYDCAIAYLQNGNIHNLYGGVQDFVINCIDARKKISFLHCDYTLSGANEPCNNRLIAKFERIAACSDGCRSSFERIMPEQKEKCITVRNTHRFDEIRALALQDTVIYPKDRPNVLMVTRLAHEKGIERALSAVAYAKTHGVSLRLHIVGSGAMEKSMHAMAQELQLGDDVVFYGEQENPYRFMPDSDLFLMTSFYEAAPMVIDEALSLSLPVFTTQTTSSLEMIKEYGWICENSQDGINTMLCRILSERDTLAKMKNRLRERAVDNEAALKQFEQLIEE